MGGGCQNNPARVNHGQIHHYFGSKRGLLEAAISKLAHAHWDHTQRDGMSPLALGKDQTYILSVIRCAIDGNLDLRENISVPRQALQKHPWSYFDIPSPGIEKRCLNTETEIEYMGEEAYAVCLEGVQAVE